MQKDKLLRVFEVPIRIRVYAGTAFDVEALRNYLLRPTRINVDTERVGDGPVEDSLVLQTAD